ncbi:hypothetical protein DD238_002946 [Peronospora effusa]|uniref:Uncharacterized protein n=1 Tax=Peronospora effusa TaxID=542832 RepID=A0A3M6VNZ8_9STRA|nr:hypothetical protein DD238_002946 [Peronospora effusa]
MEEECVVHDARILLDKLSSEGRGGLTGGTSSYKRLDQLQSRVGIKAFASEMLNNAKVVAIRYDVSSNAGLHKQQSS